MSYSVNMEDINIQSKINIERLPDEKLVRDLQQSNNFFSRKIVLSAGVIVLVGILSGYLLHNSFSKGTQSSSPVTQTENGTSGKSVGSADTKTFPDSAEGQLESGGLNGEGTHKLIRPGGNSQTVYLTSSVLDLNQFVGKKVKVWGKTYSAKKAAWLMDIGRVEVL